MDDGRICGRTTAAGQSSRDARRWHIITYSNDNNNIYEEVYKNYKLKWARVWKFLFHLKCNLVLQPPARYKDQSFSHSVRQVRLRSQTTTPTTIKHFPHFAIFSFCAVDGKLSYLTLIYRVAAALRKSIYLSSNKWPDYEWCEVQSRVRIRIIILSFARDSANTCNYYKCRRIIVTWVMVKSCTFDMDMRDRSMSIEFGVSRREVVSMWAQHFSSRETLIL